MKYEIKIEIKDNNLLKKTITESYFKDKSLGKLIGKESFIPINQEDPLFIVFKGLNNMTIKLTNDDIIDGSMRCVVDESSEIVRLFPINNYCIVEDEKYSFY